MPLFQVTIAFYVEADDEDAARNKVADNVGASIRPESGIFSDNDSPEGWGVQPWNMDG